MIWEINLDLAKDVGKLLRGEWQDGELLFERRAFQESHSGHGLFVVDILLEQPGIAAIVTAAKQDLTAMVVVKVELESLCKSQVRMRLVCRQDIASLLTSNLAIGAILPSSNINEVEQKLATCEAARKFLHVRWRRNKARLLAYLIR